MHCTASADLEAAYILRTTKKLHNRTVIPVINGKASAFLPVVFCVNNYLGEKLKGSNSGAAKDYGVALTCIVKGLDEYLKLGLFESEQRDFGFGIYPNSL